MKTIKEKHSLLMRWTHWINFPILTVMIWSGMLIYWANDVYTVTLFGHKFVHFFPESFYTLLHIPARLAEGMAFHFLFMWFFTLNGILYLLYTLISGQWRALVPQKGSFTEAFLVLLHDLHLRKIAPPQNKYNAAQRIAYTAIIVMGMGSVLTGLAIYKPVQFYWLSWILGGYHMARIFHFALTIGYVLFFVIHIVQVILAGWNNFRSVVSGFEVVQTAVPATDSSVDQRIMRRNFLSFAALFAVGGAAAGGWKWLYHSPEEVPGITAGAHQPLRRALNQSELFFRRLFSDSHYAKTYPKSMAAKNVRVNSDIGLTDQSFNPDNWKLSILKDKVQLIEVSIQEIKALPKTEITFDFKCVEGWDQIQHWAGVRLVDFIRHYQLEELAKMNYVGMETPDGGYYVGLDKESAMHPQTILAYEMNDMPISAAHGAPLRLIVPVKYGIKNLKRIGTIAFSDTRPHDYWAEQGYDYYSGL